MRKVFHEGGRKADCFVVRNQRQREGKKRDIQFVTTYVSFFLVFPTDLPSGPFFRMGFFLGGRKIRE